jgi:hypothetical protein
MKRRWWTLTALVVVLGAVVGGILYLRRPKPAPAGADTARIELTTREEAGLAKVVLSDRAEGTLALEKRGETWTDVSAPGIALSASATRDLAYYFWSLSANRAVEENPADLAPYGLAPARVKAEGTFSDGTVVTYLLGDRTPSNDGYYFQVKGDARVFTVWITVGDQFHWTLKDLRDKAITTEIKPDEIVSMRMRRPDGRVVEIVGKSAEEVKNLQLGFGRYFLVRPYHMPRGLNAEKQEAFLQQPLAVSIDDFVDDNPKDLAAYGLSTPWADVLLRDKAGNRLGYQVGARRSDGKRFFRLSGKPSVYAVEESKLSFLTTSPFDLVERFAFIPNIDDVDRLEITAGGVTHTLTLSRTTKPPAGDGADPEVVTSFAADGRPVEDGSFRKFYQSVIGLLVEGEVGNPPAGPAEVRTRYLLNKGPARDVTVSYVPYDRDFYAVFIAGRCDFAISRGQISAMLAILQRLLAGETIED